MPDSPLSGSMQAGSALVLGVESSCDETAAAVVSGDLRVLSSVVASQVSVHAPFGGVVPEIASRSHLAAVIPVIEAALADADLEPADLAGVAVTRGPGLIGALLVGVQTAKAFAWVHGLPLVGVNHLEGHLTAPRLVADAADAARPRPELPYVALLVSGGHTAVYVVRGPGQTELIGATRDDAAGEALDKFARMAGLGYPGGPVVDRLATTGRPDAVHLPRAMRGRGPDFSFSGLKTAARNHLEAHGVPPRDSQRMADLCASLQEAVADILVEKSLAACAAAGVHRLVLTGGVAANSRLRSLAAQRGEAAGVQVFAPPRSLCTDNAAMIAAAGHPLLADLDQVPADRRGLSVDARPTLPVG